MLIKDEKIIISLLEYIQEIGNEDNRNSVIYYLYELSCEQN